MNKLTFLVVGDSEAGKSSFIKNFTTSEYSKLLDISGRGQTTRCNGIYEFSSNYDDNKVDVKFYTKDEFINRTFERLMQKKELYPKKTITHENLNDISINDIEKNIDYSSWYNENQTKVFELCNNDFISDEFINLEELNIDKNSILIGIEEIKEIKDYVKFEELVKSKIEIVYKIAKEKIDTFLEKYKGIDLIDDDNDNEDIRSIDFNLNEETKLLFALCIKKIKKKERESCGSELFTLSGLVKNTKVIMKLNQLYEKICAGVGIDTITFIDTYGLDHESDEDGSIVIDTIRERLKFILNYEFKEIESVIFITPMIGKAAGTNGRFKALIEAKRSIYPQIVYTKFDSYIEAELDESISDIDVSDLQDLIEEFNKCNKNPINDNFYKILEEYYSSDVAEYRKKIILSNRAYFMGAYEKNVDSNSAQRFNLIYFKKIIMNLFQKNNLGIGNNSEDTAKFIQELERSLVEKKSDIELKLSSMLSSAQKILMEKYVYSHGNTKNAFWKRIRSNMFGFHNGLDLRRILIEQFDYVLAKDAGDRKDDNLGNVIINEYFINNELNIFIRECINDFARFYFCSGCMPCDELKPGNSEMSSSCNTTGSVGGRKRRKDSCNQCFSGFYIGSRKDSRYCNNKSIYGIGLYNQAYGNQYNCCSNCYWKSFFAYYEVSDKQNISLNVTNDVNCFIQIFIEFCKEKYEKAKNNLANITYLDSNDFDDYFEKSENIDFKQFSTITQDVIVITEGKTDKMHLENAWKKLKKGDMPYFICDASGADNIPLFLKSCPNEIRGNKVFVGIFDNDNKGQKLFKYLAGSFIYDNYIKKVSQNDKNYYSIILPFENKTIEYYEAGEIEFLYSREFLDQSDILQKRSFDAINVITYVKNEQKQINIKDYSIITELEYFEPKNKNKTSFAEFVNQNLDKIEEKHFTGFEKVFDFLDYIGKDLCNV